MQTHKHTRTAPSLSSAGRSSSRRSASSPIAASAPQRSSERFPHPACFLRASSAKQTEGARVSDTPPPLPLVSPSLQISLPLTHSLSRSLFLSFSLSLRLLFLPPFLLALYVLIPSPPLDRLLTLASSARPPTPLQCTCVACSLTSPFSLPTHHPLTPPPCSCCACRSPARRTRTCSRCRRPPQQGGGGGGGAGDCGRNSCGIASAPKRLAACWRACARVCVRTRVRVGVRVGVGACSLTFMCARV
jgi:hypothetical protein